MTSMTFSSVRCSAVCSDTSCRCEELLLVNVGKLSFWLVMLSKGSDPKILGEYIHNILHIHIYKQILSPFVVFLYMAASLSLSLSLGVQPSD